MASDNKIVDYLDVRLALPPGTESDFAEWLECFVQQHDFVEITPRLRNGELHINSTDLIAFLGYVDPQRLNDLQQQKLRSGLRQVLEQLLLRSVSVHRQDHYKWCLAALKNLKLGRYRTEETGE